MAEVFADRDRPDMTDDDVRRDILLEASQPLGLPAGMFSRRQGRIIEELRAAGVLVDGGSCFILSEDGRRMVAELIGDETPPERPDLT